MMADGCVTLIHGCVTLTSYPVLRINGDAGNSGTSTRVLKLTTDSAAADDNNSLASVYQLKAMDVGAFTSIDFGLVSRSWGGLPDWQEMA